MLAKHRVHVILLALLAAGTGLGIVFAQADAVTHPGVVMVELAKAGKVSAAVYDGKGRLVRELLHAVPKEPGKHALVWDGLDRDGKSLPAGEYTWKLLQTQGLKASYVMGVGSNYPPGNAWPFACGPGTHSAPHGVAVDKTGIYVAAHTTENIETCVLKMTPDGKKRVWSALHPRAWDGALSLAADGGELYMLGHVAVNDGRIEPVKKRKQMVYVFDAATGKLADRTVTGSAIGNIPTRIEVQWDVKNDDLDATDMDVRDGVMVVAYAKRNAIRWNDPKKPLDKSQREEVLDTVEVASPQGVAIGAGGVVYVTTGDRIVSLSRKNKTSTDVVNGLDKPGRIAVDSVSGDLLVYVAGTQQIKRFGADGKLKNTYGEKGGRQDGIYDDQAKRSFAGFADLCADGSGGFYVTESSVAPRRTAHFAGDGSLIREWYGGQRWAPHAAPEGDNPNVLWVGSEYGWIMRVLVDYDKKTWTVHSCYKYTGLGDGLVGDSHNEGCYFRVYKHGGNTYIALERLPTILKVDEKNWRLVPVTVCGAVAHAPKLVKDWAGKNQTFQWNDANGDGLPQKDEMTFYAGGIPSSYEPIIAGDFTCFTVSHDKEGRRVHKFPVTRWTEAGAPVYGNMPGGTLHAACPPRFDAGHFADSRWSVFMHHDLKTGRLHAAFNDWTRDWCDYADSFMHQWSPAGELAWTVGRRGSGRILPGEVHTHLRGVAGIAHGCVIGIDVDGGWNGNNHARTYVWDQDGLFAGGLMDSPNLDGIEKYWYQCGGEFCHSSVHTLPSGDVLFYGNWENEMRVYRISGWDGFTRQSGIIRLTQPAKDRTGQGLAGAYFDDAGLTKLRTARIDARLDMPMPAKAAGVRWTGTLLPDYGPSYTGPWTIRHDKEFFDGTAHASRDDNASMTFRFRGNSISIVGATGPNHGFADIVLDGERQPRADCYSPKPMRGVSFFSKSDLAKGDHEITVTVVGWYGKPRNKASSDSWVVLDKFIVNGHDYDDTGLPHSFTAHADGKLRLWVDHTPVIFDETARTGRADVKGKTVKLLRQPTALQLDYAGGADRGGVMLSWSHPFAPLAPMPTRCLYPVIPGGHTDTTKVP